MNGSLRIRILKTAADIESLRDAWERWEPHPHADLDFFLTIVRIRPEVIGPYVLALYRNDVLETILVGRLERRQFTLNIGYWRLIRVPVRALSFVYGGLLGNASDENCAALVRQLQSCLKLERAALLSLHFVQSGSPMHRTASRIPGILCRDYFPETQPHWVMRLPASIEDLYRAMSPKTRQTRRYQVNRLMKRFPAARVECYSKEADLDRVMEDAETIARGTYQRGLGVGFVANGENRERFALEASRGRFRAYFLYLGDKPVAFFLGTLSKHTLFDHFTAYDPEYASHSPGTVLFLHIFERLCREGVGALDFGFGDAPYKAQFGTDRVDETTITVFAPTVRGIGLNALRVPSSLLDGLARRTVQSLGVLRSVKKWWRSRAQQRTNA